MGMFGGLLGRLGIGGQQQPVAPDMMTSVDDSVPMGSMAGGAPSGMSPNVTAGQPFASVPQPPAPVGGMFGAQKPSFMERLGMVGDILTDHPVFTPMIQQRQQEIRTFAQQRNQQFWETQRQLQLAQWKREHPEDDEFTRTVRAAGIDPSSAQGQALYLQRAQSQAAPPLVAVDGFDPQGNPTKTFMPRTLPGTASTSSLTPAPVTDKAGYDALPPGAAYLAPDGSHRVKGGAAPQASAPFPR